MTFHLAKYLYQWNPFALSKIATACDLALIPISLDNAFNMGKPENKLLLFWRMGIPTVVSTTPAYDRVMKQCDLPMACREVSDWHTTLENYMSHEFLRKQAGQIGRAFVETHYSEKQLLNRWDNVFEMIFR